MKRTINILMIFAAIFIAASCNKEDKLKVEQLQEELESLQKGDLPGVPASSVEDVPDDLPFFFAFDKTRYGVDAGSTVSIPYTLQQAATVTVSVKGGWKAVVKASGPAEGTIEVTAPDPASPVELVATAVTEDGLEAAVILPLLVRDPYTDATRTTVGALAYYCLDTRLAIDYHFQKLAECGMNMITIEEVNNWETQLTLAEKYGIKGVLFVNGSAGDYYRGNHARLEQTIAKAKTYPALAGYQIYDEPSTENIAQIKYEKDAIESLDPNPGHPVYVNLHPSSASKSSLGVEDYFEYVETFVSECNLQLITFDQYPVYQGYIDPSWPRSLAAVRQSALRHDIPFWAFACSCREWNRVDPTLETLRLQCNTNLAYGAQVNQFFVYRSTSGTDLAPLQTWEYNPDGTKRWDVAKYTAAYDVLKAYCTEMHNLGYVFAGSDVKAVRKTQVLDAWNESLSVKDLPPQINSLFTSREAVVSFVENRGNEYMVVVNSLWNWTQQVAIDLSDVVYVIDHDGNFTELQPGVSRFDLEGGDMLVFKYR
ncbi:MAG: hypothetical protein IKN31_01365 [Bacteroidales bacterium]|nr:hypothetical protein [Bacteroidales bacterium]